MIEGQCNHGCNAANGSYGDLVEQGVPDPAKATHTALQNAASVASLILTTEAIVAGLPKDEALTPAAGRAPGGFGGADFQPVGHTRFRLWSGPAATWG